ncbi:hypothetical protein T265_08835 [Opisthorchis viverrini]|uniref:Uncharacterized protein n=1 Tax=Opisthorchis viverrini TaxID=6198 RepID=A0A074ZCB4_OPIVI|nr:hypothetical protein T265_08835 [Opisthorchis viverrini]KER23222.1 hypothetical protein T265_08835 [Opisthorchis viverrini]
MDENAEIYAQINPYTTFRSAVKAEKYDVKNLELVKVFKHMQCCDYSGIAQVDVILCNMMMLFSSTQPSPDAAVKRNYSEILGRLVACQT